MLRNLNEWLKLEGDGGNGKGGGGGTGDGTGNGDKGSGQGGGGTGEESWRDGITDEHLRGAPGLQKFDGLDALARGYIDLEAYQGQSIRIPGEDASPEAVKEFHNRLTEKVPGLIPTPDPDNAEALGTLYRQLGQPEAAEGYKIPEIDTGDTEVDMSLADSFRGIAHEFGLSQRQYEGIIRKVTENNIRVAGENRDAHNEDQKSLHDEWGLAYDDNRKAALNVAKQTGAPQDLITAIEKRTASAATLKWLFDIHKQSGGEGLNFGRERGSGALAPGEAQAKIDEIMSNREHPYWNAQHPGNKAAVQRMLELQKAANPEASTNVNDLRAGGMGQR